MSCGSSNAGSQIAAQQAQQQQLTNQAVGNINQAFSGFTPQWFNQASNAYSNWAVPQLQQQFQQNQNGLNFQLANQGLLGSSQQQTGQNALQTNQNQAQQQIGQQALAQQQGLQQQVAQQKSNLIGQAQTATNPTATGQQALTAASQFAIPSSFQPLGNLFSNFATQYLGNQQANTYNPYTTSLLSQNLYGLGGSGSNGGFLPSTQY
jgi:hypothetical protein